MASCRVLIYLLRRDLRCTDNPILHDISRSFQQSQHPFTHLLPVYVFAAQQIEVSGFIPKNPDSSARSPYPEARSNVAGFWRCGPHRAKFLAESVFDMKKSLQNHGSNLEVRVGTIGHVVSSLLEGFKTQNDTSVVGVWMTDEEGVEEKREEREAKKAAEQHGTEFKLWTDEKYLVDDRDIPCKKPRDLPDVFSDYRKQVEPLRDAPRRSLPAPDKLPPMPPTIPEQAAPFSIPSTLEETIEALQSPIKPNLGLASPPQWPKGAHSAHPFTGGEATAHDRVKHLITSGHISTYKDTRNGMLGPDFSTKLSAWLALGCISARQVHKYLVEFEDGATDLGKGTHGYGKGENKGTAAVRFELLWRDYFRLATRKFGPRLFRVQGFRNEIGHGWLSPSKSDPRTQNILKRWLEGRTGMGFVDASMRELFLTGYTSNRLRQNVASFLAKHMGLDWRIGAEWYESLLVDYDLSSNWGNWQYVSGVGNDPREQRIFNPVKQAYDYDGKGEYVRTWVPEVKNFDTAERLEVVFQAWKMTGTEKADAGLNGDELVEEPLKRINFGPKSPKPPKLKGKARKQVKKLGVERPVGEHAPIGRDGKPQSRSKFERRGRDVNIQRDYRSGPMEKAGMMGDGAEL